MGEQLALGLPPREDYSAASFVEGEANAAARQALAGWNAWPGRVLAMYGPSGSGKTHLAHIWAESAQAVYLYGSDLESALDKLPADRPIVVDNADADADRTALFHLINRAAKDDVQAVLLISREPPSRWNTEIADLRSRLLSLPTAELQEPDDALLTLLLKKLFTDRQAPLVDGLIEYLLTRMERSVEAARQLVDDLDKDALARRTRINRGVARRVLENWHEDED